MVRLCDNNKFRILIAFGVVVFATAPGFAKSPRELIAEGNGAYRGKQYDRALEAYDKASVDAPESPVIYFNKGAVYLQKQDYEKAKDAFEKAALKTGDLAFEARCRYNLGCCAFGEGERQRGSDLKKALTAYETSIRCFQAALKLDPRLHDAAHNIEVARLVLKDILDQLKKQQEDAQKQQKEQEEIIKKLKELIDRQQGHIKQNDKIAAEKPTATQPAKREKQIADLAGAQNKTKEETKVLSQKLTQSPTQTQPADNPAQKAREHLDGSVREQAMAEALLRKQQLPSAKPPQQQALKKLQDALAALTQPQQNQNQQNQDKKNEQNKQDQQEKQDKQSSQDKDKDKKEQAQQQQSQENKDSKDKKDRQKAQARPDENARDILNEEKENRDQRNRNMQGTYEPVDKDW